MRYTGILVQWNDERGFGFIQPSQGGRDLFVHISDLPGKGAKPTVGEKLSYELAKNTQGKLQAVQVIREAFGPARSQPPQSPAAVGSSGASRRSRSSLGTVLVLVFAIAAGAYTYSRYYHRPLNQPMHPPVQDAVPMSPAVLAPAPVLVPGNPGQSLCDGRKYCSQMTSCTEAKYFLSNCPDTRMDGNHDGIPCQEQWCTSPNVR